MRTISSFPAIILFILLTLSSCAGIKYMTVETREPAKVNLPSSVLSIAIVNNVVPQPANVGHDSIPLGRKLPEKVTASSDSASIFYTEALTQFLNEEDYFQNVICYNQPLRNDKDFFKEIPISPEKMNEIRKETGADAIVSLDKLIIETHKKNFFLQQDYMYAEMTGKIFSILRVYMPTISGKIPSVQYSDSIRWEGFDIQDGKAYAEMMIPSVKEAVKIVSVMAAEKMTYVFTPHWAQQDRWYYTLPNSTMREGETFAKGAEWSKAIECWKAFFQQKHKTVDKAKAATNIALAYEMMDDMTNAAEWAKKAYTLFNESTSVNSLDRKRSLLYKNEIERRLKNSISSDMDTP